MRRLAFFQLLLIVAAPALSATLEELRAVESDSTVEIQTVGRKTGKPRTATIWFVHEHGVVYVQAGGGGKTDWYRNLRKTPDVLLDFGSFEVKGRAAPVEDPKEVERIHGLFLGKYWTARVANWFGRGFGTGKVVRIEVLTSARDGELRYRPGAGAAEVTPPALPRE